MVEFGCTRGGFNIEHSLLPLVHGRIFLAISHLLPIELILPSLIPRVLSYKASGLTLFVD